MNRRHLLGGAAAAIGGGSIQIADAAAKGVTIADTPDAQLLQLAAEVRAADLAQEAAAGEYSDAEEQGDEAAAAAAETRRAAAFKAWSNGVERMAEIPAASMAGLAAKAALVVREARIGTSAADSILTESALNNLFRPFGPQLDRGLSG